MVFQRCSLKCLTHLQTKKNWQKWMISESISDHLVVGTEPDESGDEADDASSFESSKEHGVDVRTSRQFNETVYVKAISRN